MQSHAAAGQRTICDPRRAGSLQKRLQRCNREQRYKLSIRQFHTLAAPLVNATAENQSNEQH
jgi:hypothetical protein